MDKSSKTILDILLETNRLTQTEATNFDVRENNYQIEIQLREKNLVSSDDIARAYSILYELPIVRLENLEIPPNLMRIVPSDLEAKYQMVAFEKELNSPNGKIKIAIGAPASFENDKEEITKEFKNKNIIPEYFITTLEDARMIIDRINIIQKATISPQKKEEQPKPQYVEVEMEKPISSTPIASTANLKTVDLTKIQIPYEVISKFPIEVSTKYNMIVFDNPSPSIVKVAVSDPYNQKVKEILDFVKDKNEISIDQYVASPSEISNAIKTYYKKPVDRPPDVVNPNFSLNSPKVPPVINQPKNTQSNSSIQVQSEPQIPPAQPQQAQQAQQPQQPQQPHPQTQQVMPQKKPQEERTIEQDLQRPPEENLDLFLGMQVKDDATLNQIIQTGDVPRILAATLALAVYKKASDVHIEAEEKDIRIRFRIDGVLRDVAKLNAEIGPAIISRIKILSKLKIDEQRIPQDGRFDVTAFNRQIDLRVSTLPTVFGEKAAIRILDKSQNIFDLEKIGLLGKGLKAVENNIIKPYGIILATGPTGSGKSTTLYSILQRISKPQINVITLEDPIEYEISGINQCQIKPKIGFTFAEGLRSVLRQDPNIIMVGEIRDAETAGMATHAALTGHLVLTTLHTNNAAGALPRLINMGIEPFLITSSINIIIAQRLVRKICPKCKQEAKVPPELMEEIERELAQFNLPKPYKFFEAKGCDECTLGYSGRVGIYEVLEVSDKIEELAIKMRPSSEIEKAAREEGMVTLKQDGLIKASRGLTTISEVLRVAMT